MGALPKLVLADAGAASRFAGSPVPGIKFRDTLGVLLWTRRTSFEENPRDPFGWTAPRAPDRGAKRAVPSSNGISRYKFLERAIFMAGDDNEVNRDPWPTSSFRIGVRIQPPLPAAFAIV